MWQRYQLEKIQVNRVNKSNTQTSDREKGKIENFQFTMAYEREDTANIENFGDRKMPKSW